MQWEMKFPRPYFRCAAKQSSMDCVWEQSIRNETVSGQGLHSAQLLQDGVKYYESFSWSKLQARGDRLGFPMPLMRLNIAAYQSPRYIILENKVASPVWASRGVVAGCGAATTHDKVYSLEPLDQFVEDHPQVKLDTYVDDFSVGAVGTINEVVEDTVEAEADLKEIMEEELEGSFGSDKAGLVASSSLLARCLHKRLDLGNDPLRTSSRTWA